MSDAVDKKEPPEEKAPLLEGHEPDPDVTSHEAEKQAAVRDSSPSLAPAGAVTGHHAPAPPPLHFSAVPPGYMPNPMPPTGLPNVGGPPINPNNVLAPETFWELPENMRALLFFLGISIWLVALTFGSGLLVCQLAGFLGTIAAFINILPRRGGPLADRVNLFAHLAFCTVVADVFAIIQLLLIVFLFGVGCEEDPDELTPQICNLAFIFTALVMLVLSLHTWLSVLIWRKAHTVKMMLNPVSSGMVV